MFDYQRCNDLWPDQATYSGAGDENRTRMASLEGWGSAIELHPRFRDDLETAVPEILGVSSPSRSRGDRTRTCDLLLPKQTR